MKKIILVIIDALATRVVRPAMEQGGLPHMRRLSDAGGGLKDCTAIFPSITPAATASLVTGSAPRQHGICGNYWYDAQRDEVAFYGDDWGMIWETGLSRYFRDFLVTLNESRLATPTAFEHVAGRGKTSACLNLMWFHGPQPHPVNVPLILEMIAADAFPQFIHGPEVLYLGDFVTTSVQGQPLAGSGGILRRYGFHDAATASVLLQLAEANALPDFTVAYFPDNDFESHKRGGPQAIDVLEKVDETLGGLIEALGGIDTFLDHYAIVITGDHAQSDLIEDASVSGLSLQDVLSEFITSSGATWPADANWMICPNMRAAQLYCRNTDPDQFAAVQRTLLACKGIDQVIRRSRTESGREQFEIATSDRGTLRFHRAAPSEAGFRDHYGSVWSCTGELNAINAHLDGDTISFNAYPNALERIANGFSTSSGDLWVTATLGHEFCLPWSSGNQHGSHGSLHEQDSLSPLIAAGLPEEVLRSQSLRSVDVLGLCLSGLVTEVRTRSRLQVPAMIAAKNEGLLERERNFTCQPS